MLAYAADRRRVAERHWSPRTLFLIAAAHAALLGAVMSARMDLPERIFPPPIVVTAIPIPKPPPPDPQARPKPPPMGVGLVPPIVPLPIPNDDGLDTAPTPLPIPGGDTIGTRVDPLPAPVPVRVGPRFATPLSDVRPPYPLSKIESEEQAILKLRLTIDSRGRVIAVEPVGKADAAFLAAARRHLIAHWRYRPATEDGRAIASATLITLRFELE